jgi:hypothetical protein
MRAFHEKASRPNALSLWKVTVTFLEAINRFNF